MSFTYNPTRLRDYGTAIATAINVSGEVIYVTKLKEEDMIRKEKKKMRDYHIDAEGNQQLIVEMDDNHLVNTIGYFVKQLQAAKDILENSQNAFQKAMYGARFDKSAATNYVKNFNSKIALYVLEAVIRGIDITAQVQAIQETIGRKEALTKVTNVDVIEYKWEDG